MSEPGASQYRGPVPYVGPRPFRRTEAQLFFGRQPEARDVCSLWLGNKVTVLHGPVAVGKTSLLQAGVLPLLSGRPGIGLLLVGSLGHQPTRPLASPPPHNGYTFALLDNWARLGQPPAIGASVTEFLLARAEGLADQDDPRDVLIAIDQFEALFSTFPARQDERDGFIDELGAALTRLPALKLMLVVGDDHLAALRSYERRLAPHRFGYVQLDALELEAALEAVALPLSGTGRSFAAGVADELVERLRTVTYTDLAGASATIRSDVVEPLLLQIVCTELQSTLPVDMRLIGSDDLSAFGDVDQALGRFYDAAVTAVQGQTGQPEELLRTWIESAFITEHGTRGFACRGILTTAGMDNDVADAFERRRVLVLEYRARTAWYQLSQDRMIAAIQKSNRAWHSRRGPAVVSESPPATPMALSTAAEAALAEGDFPSAHRFAQAAAADYREAGDTRRLAHALVLQGDIARTEGDLVAAERSLHAALSTFTVLQDHNSEVRTLSALANVHFTAGEYDKAAGFQREAVDLRPADAEALLGLGYALWYGGSAADAEATFTLALRSDPRSASAAAGRGQVRAEMREYATALSDLDQALYLGLPPAEEIDVRSARALALAGLGRQQEADRELVIARTADQSRGRTLRRAARIATLRQDRELAVAEAERALQADPPLSPWDNADVRRLLRSLGHQSS
jgi:tetratricopeptide (TPR) repeat protein